MEHSLNTLLEQTYQNYELILVNDGSSNESGSICEIYAKNNPKLVKVVHKENGDIFCEKYRNCKCQRQIYYFSDPGDWVDCNYIEQLVKLQKEYQCDLAVTGYFIKFEEGDTRTNLKHEHLNIMIMHGGSWLQKFYRDLIRLVCKVKVMDMQ